MTSRQQLALDLPGHPAQGREDFFAAPSNATALAMVERWPDWIPPKLVVTGPQGCGKSHLVAVWAGRSGGTVLEARGLEQVDIASLTGPVAVEDADRCAGNPAAERVLFHLHNHVLEAGGSILLTGRARVVDWGIALPDLASRLLAAGSVAMAEPDDALFAAIIVKLFEDRQLIVAPDLISYVVTRIDRSYAEAARVVALLDRAALSKRRRVTRALAVEVLNGDF